MIAKKRKWGQRNAEEIADSLLFVRIREIRGQPFGPWNLGFQSCLKFCGSLGFLRFLLQKSP
jgi:hypothetical protein